MPSLNKIILIGHVGRDPEVRYMPSGEPVANFSLATSEKWKSKDGEQQERTEWHRVEVFGGVAKVVQDYVKKGRALYIEGQIRTDEWEDKEGNKRQTTKVRVSGPNSKLLLLGGGGNGEDYQKSSAKEERKTSRSKSEEDDLPF